MKNEQRLIIRLLNSLALKHNEMSFKYGYDQSLNEHLVEVGPREKFDDEQYLMDEVEVIGKFIAHHADKSLSFVSADGSLKVESPIYQIKVEAAGPASKARTSIGKYFGFNWSRLFQH